MWGQLAGRISKIGDVVAPALSNDEDDDEEDEDYEDEGEEDEEDEGEYEEEEDDDEEEETGAPAGGFVGFLTRALDGAKHSSTPSKSQQQDSIQTSTLQPQQQHQQQNQVEELEEEGDEEEDEDVIDLDQQPSIQGSLFPLPNQQQQQNNHHQQHQSSALSSMSNSDDDMVLVPAANEVLASMVASTAIVTPTSSNIEPTAVLDNKKETLDHQPPSVAITEPAKPKIQLRVPDSSKLSTAVSPSLSSHTPSHHPKLSVTRITQQQPSKPSSAKRLVVPSTQILPKQSSVAAPNSSPRLNTPLVDQPAPNASPKEGAKVTPSTVVTTPARDSIEPKEALIIKPVEGASNSTSDVKQEQPEISSKDQSSSDSTPVTLESEAELKNNSVIPETTPDSKQEEKEATDDTVAFYVNPTDFKVEPSPKVDEVGKALVAPTAIKTQPPVQTSPTVPIDSTPQPKESSISSVEKPHKQSILGVEVADQSFDMAHSNAPNPVTKFEEESVKHDVQLQQSPLQKATTATIDKDDSPSDELARWQAHCQELESRLQEVQDKLLQSEQVVWEKEQQSEQQRQELMMKFQEKEIRLLEASNEDHQQELEQMRQDAELLCQSLQQQMEQERKMALQQQQQLSRLLTEAESRVENAEESKKSAISKVQAELAQVQQRQKRSIQMAEDKLAQAMAKLDERDEEIRKLKTTVSTLQSKMTQHQEGAQEAEEEMDELHSENETLRQHVQGLQEECTTLRTHIDELEADAEKYSGLEMELKKMKDAYERERALTQSAAQNLESDHAQAESERDAALAEMKNLQQQLAAALADVNVSRSDTERIMMANANLQNALEAFQSEREAEMALLEEQRRAAEEATAAAHAAALDAMRESNDAKMKEVSIAADKAIRNIMEEVNQLERRVEGYRKENVQLRRSLDEAIHQLQMNQEDVIDRTLMKNVLLEWFAMKGRKEKRQVLEMMASLLHFTEDEKEKIHIIAGTGALSKVVGAVAAPLPPAATDHPDGNTVSEKWVNFLLAETDDGDANNPR